MIAKPTYFISNAHARRFGSTIMRACQLPEILASHLGDRSIQAVDEADMPLGDAIVFLPKNMFQPRNEPMLDRLKAEGAIIVGDLCDQHANAHYKTYCNIVVAASEAGRIAAQEALPGIPALKVTHHVDPRIAAGNTAQGLRTGYFGMLQNTVSSDEIEVHVEFRAVQVTKQHKLTPEALSWLDDISGYNCHYAVRNARHFDGLKPFTKGFTAAHCAANVVIQKTEPDVMEYLGEDYPYLLDGECTEADIVEMLERVRSDFGGPDWARGLDRMRWVAEHSSPAFIANEFRDVLRIADDL